MYYAIIDDETSKPVKLCQLTGQFSSIFSHVVPLFTSKEEANNVLFYARQHNGLFKYWIVKTLGEEEPLPPDPNFPNPPQINEAPYWIPGQDGRIIRTQIPNPDGSTHTVVEWFANFEGTNT